MSTGSSAARTTVYFVRHAESDRSVTDPQTRPLTPRGQEDARLLVGRFAGVAIDALYSSPYDRAVATLRPLAEDRGLAIITIRAFQERRSDTKPQVPLRELVSRQWDDFSYTESDGETLAQVQQRNLAALHDVLRQHRGQTVAIGTHGMAMTTVMRHFREEFPKQELAYILETMPFVLRMVWEDDAMVSMEEVKGFK